VKEMTTVELQAAIRTAIEPLSSSVEKLTDKFDEHRIEMVKSVAEIKTDIKYLKDSQEKADDQIDDLREKTASIRTKSVTPMSIKMPPSLSNGNGGIRIPMPSKYIPWLIMSVILGAALAGGLLFGGSRVAAPSQAAPAATSSTSVEKATTTPSIEDTVRRTADAAKRAAEAARAVESVWNPASPLTETMEESK
jgi:hypothetical protein